jgi:arabinogalactan oligomer / maltooligosaccharide transport system substrate-binding protein
VFVGVQGFMISSFSENVDLAKTFLLDYLNTEELQLELFDAGGRPPAMTSAFEQVADDPIIQGFGLSGQQGAPLPAIPEMSAVWGAGPTPTTWCSPAPTPPRRSPMRRRSIRPGHRG